MENITVEKIRKAIIIHVLLDLERHSTKDIIEKTNTLLKYYKNKPPINKSKKLDTKIISKPLKKLVDENIIERKPREKEGRGPAENTYKLVDNVDAFKKIVKLFRILYYYEIYIISSLMYSLDLVRNPFTKKYIDKSLIKWIESEIDAILTEDESKYLLKLLRIFPYALYATIIIPETINDFLSKFPDSKVNEFDKKDFYFSELMNALEFDTCNPLLNLPCGFEYKQSFKLIGELGDLDYDISLKEVVIFSEAFDIKRIPSSVKSKKDRTYLNPDRKEIGIRCKSVDSILKS